jgi:hypothetical protein
MINPFKEINWQPQRADLRSFAKSLIIGFPCIALVFFLVKWFSASAMPEPRFYFMLGGIGAAVGLVWACVPVIARPLYYVWYALAGCIGIVMANLLFCLLFFGLFLPIGLFMRLIGRDALRLRLDKSASTYWLDAPPTPPATSYFSQY